MRGLSPPVRLRNNGGWKILTKESKKQDNIKTTENVVSTFAVTFMFSTVVATSHAATCDHRILKTSCLVPDFAFLGDQGHTAQVGDDVYPCSNLSPNFLIIFL